MNFEIHRGVGFVLAAILASACGASADSSDGVTPFVAPEPVVPTLPTPAVEDPGNTDLPGEGSVPATDPVLTPQEPAAPAPEPELEGCRAPDGVSGRPRNLEQAVQLLNALPRPTTLPCFIEALERPIEVFMTRSNQSLQPSPGERSPRTFIVNAPLVMSIVFEGDASVTLELGYRTQETRSIKTELKFPLQREVTFTNLFDEIRDGQVTRCSACHTAETETFDPGIQANVFESDIYPPFEVYDVDVETVRAENASCDATAEPARCALLSALFDHGDVVTAPQGILFNP